MKLDYSLKFRAVDLSEKSASLLLLMPDNLMEITQLRGRKLDFGLSSSLTIEVFLKCWLYIYGCFYMGSGGGGGCFN